MPSTLCTAKIMFFVEMAREASRNGGKEIVITGVNIGEFGKDNGNIFSTFSGDYPMKVGLDVFTWHHNTSTVIELSAQ